MGSHNSSRGYYSAMFLLRQACYCGRLRPPPLCTAVLLGCCVCELDLRNRLLSLSSHKSDDAVLPTCNSTHTRTYVHLFAHRQIYLEWLPSAPATGVDRYPLALCPTLGNTKRQMRDSIRRPPAETFLRELMLFASLVYLFWGPLFSGAFLRGAHVMGPLWCICFAGTLLLSTSRE